MSEQEIDQLRAAVREVLAEVVPELGRSKPRRVRVSDSTDLNAFVRTVIGLLDDPVSGLLLRNGGLSFELAGNPAASPAIPEACEPATDPQPQIVVERGVVSERIVTRAVREGARIVAGPRTVITPLAREQIRRSSVVVERVP